MATSPLAQAWSLDITQHPAFRPSAPPYTEANFYDWFPNNLLNNRWGQHLLSILLHVVPESQARLRNEGLIPCYEHGRNLIMTLKRVADAQGIAVPPFPDVSENWKEEISMDCKTLSETLMRDAAKPVRDLIALTDDAFKEGKHHWSTWVAVIAVGADTYVDTMGITPKESIGSEKAVQFAEDVSSKALLECTRVMREEIMKIRDAAEETGWNEQEAREVTTKYFESLAAFITGWRS